jgi:hypothetical protein
MEFVCLVGAERERKLVGGGLEGRLSIGSLLRFGDWGRVSSRMRSKRETPAM